MARRSAATKPVRPGEFAPFSFDPRRRKRFGSDPCNRSHDRRSGPTMMEAAATNRHTQRALLNQAHPKRLKRCRQIPPWQRKQNAERTNAQANASVGKCSLNAQVHALHSISLSPAWKGAADGDRVCSLKSILRQTRRFHDVQLASAHRSLRHCSTLYAKFNYYCLLNWTAWNNLFFIAHV